MTDYNRGEVVLVSFVFPDQTGAKRRPALVISSEMYMQRRQEVVISAITSNVRRILPGDTVLTQWEQAGLLAPSLVTGIVRTINQRAITRKIGRLPGKDLSSVEASLRLSLGL